MGDRPEADRLAERAGAELVEVLDGDGQVIDVVPRSEMRAGNLLHRCTYVVVLAAEATTTPIDPAQLTPDTGLWIHQRADWKDTSPGHWDLAFGGVCGVGEDWRDSAERELAEEAGIVGVSLTDLGRSRYEDDVTRVLGRVFLTAWPSTPDCPDGEVVAVERTTLGRLAAFARSVPVCADSAAILIPKLTMAVRQI